ncbi:MAG TPA: hypothetical protein VK928_11265 [Longimicrobiales bacterium]|nr:hypothetical protein [Longimicrobiales bacterium]
MVHVIVRPVDHDETDGEVDDTPGIICIEHGEECMGIRCPLFDLPTDSAMQRFEWFQRNRPSP